MYRLERNQVPDGAEYAPELFSKEAFMKKSNRQYVKQYFHSFYQNNSVLYLFSIIFTILSVPANLFGSWLLGQVIDAITEGSLKQLSEVLIISITFIFSMFVVTVLLYYFKSNFIRNAMVQYRSLVFQKITEKNIAAFSCEYTGSYISLLTHDTSSIEENYLKKTFLLLHYILLFWGTLVMMLRYSIVLTIATVILGLLPAVVSALMGKELAVREKIVSDKSESFVNQLKNLLTGFSVIKSFQSEKEAQELFNTANIVIQESKCKRYWWECLLSTVSENLCGSIMQFGIFLFGAFLAIRGKITAGTVLLFFNLCNFIIMPINIVPQYLASRKAAASLINKLSQMTMDNIDYTGEDIDICLSNSICFDDVTFGYMLDCPVLRNISFKLEAGKKYALVGDSGSGKSTILNLLMGAYKNYSGSITIDGKPLREISSNSLYKLISVVDQNVFIFNGTILQNITLYRDFPQETIEMAILKTGLTALIEQRGGDYLCGENGINLSGGEKQRISIARCLLRGTPVILFDEATASLDKISSNEIAHEVLCLEGVTRLVVSHQLDETLLRQYDDIIVLREGSICEHGKFEELIERKSYFYSLYNVTNG